MSPDGPKRHGGARPGAGRPKNSTNRRSRELLERLKASGGKDPVEVMTEVMADLIAAGDGKGAALVAKDLAPYVHPKLSAVEMTQKDPHADLNDEEARLQMKATLQTMIDKDKGFRDWLMSELTKQAPTTAAQSA